MAVKQVWIDGLWNLIDPDSGKPETIENSSGQQVKRMSISQGSAIEIRPGLFLTAAHIFLGPTDGPKGADIYSTNPDYTTFMINGTINDSDKNILSRKVSGGSVISKINTYGYSAIGRLKTGYGPDLGSFQAASQGGSTGIVVFNKNPTLKQLNNYFPNGVSYTGYPKYDVVDVPGQPTEAKPSTQTVLSIDQIIKVGGVPVSGGPGTLQISGASQDGQSGAGVLGIAKGTTNTYVLGTIQGKVSTSTASTVVNYVNGSEFNSLFSNYSPPAGGKFPKNIEIGSATGKDSIRGTNASENIIADGGGNKILAGSNGDIVNPGNGLANEVFIPSNDTGTTVIVTPGSTTIVGGTTQDRLSVLFDRVWNTSAGVPSSQSVSNESSTITLLGGFYNAQVDTGPVPSDAQFTTQNSVAAQQGSTNPSTWEIGNYDLSADYQFNGTDLKISVIAHNPTIQTDPIMWRSNIDLVNYQPGEFGLSFKDWNLPAPNWSDPQGTALAKYTAIQNDELSMMAAPQAQSDLDDDASNVWNYTSMQPITPPSQAQLNSDLQALQNLYGTSSTSAVATSAAAKSAVTTTSLYASDLEQKSTDSASNIFYGSPANNILAGNEKSDVFIFGPASGRDTVTNFKTGGFNHDLIQFDHSIFANASSALAASTQIGNDVLISISGNNSVLLENTHLNKLSTSEFRIA